MHFRPGLHARPFRLGPIAAHQTETRRLNLEKNFVALTEDDIQGLLLLPRRQKFLGLFMLIGRWLKFTCGSFAVHRQLLLPVRYSYRAAIWHMDVDGRGFRGLEPVW